jgi:hypothetical protein
MDFDHLKENIGRLVVNETKACRDLSRDDQDRLLSEKYEDIRRWEEEAKRRVNDEQAWIERQATKSKTSMPRHQRRTRPGTLSDIIEELSSKQGVIASDLANQIQDRELSREHYGKLARNLRHGDKDITEGIAYVTTRQFKLMQLADEKTQTNFLDIMNYNSVSASSVEHGRVVGYIGDIQQESAYEGADELTHIGSIKAQTLAKDASNVSVIAPQISSHYIGDDGENLYVESTESPMKTRQIGRVAEHSTFKNIKAESLVGMGSKHCYFENIKGSDCLSPNRGPSSYQDYSDNRSVLQAGLLAVNSEFKSVHNAYQVGEYAERCTFTDVKASHVGGSAKQSSFENVRNARSVGRDAEQSSFDQVRRVEMLGYGSQRSAFSGLEEIRRDGRFPDDDNKSQGSMYDYKHEDPYAETSDSSLFDYLCSLMKSA